MRFWAATWAAAGFATLGCPLLVDDHLEVVPNDTTTAGTPPGVAGQPSTGADGGADAAGDGSATAGAGPGAGAGPSAGGEGATCGVSKLAAADEACPAECDRCEAGRCIFECLSEGGCEKRAFACPPGLACKVACTAKAACTGADITCPPGFDCDVECADEDSCKEVSVRCATGNCNIHCLAEKACDKARVMCTSAQCGAECLGPMAAPMVDCKAACSCNPC